MFIASDIRYSFLVNLDAAKVSTRETVVNVVGSYIIHKDGIQ